MNRGAEKATGNPLFSEPKRIRGTRFFAKKPDSPTPPSGKRLLDGWRCIKGGAKRAPSSNSGSGRRPEAVSELPSLPKPCYENYHFPGSQAPPGNPYLPGSAR